MSWHISKAMMDRYENSPSSQEQAAGYWAGNSLDGAPSAPSKSNPTPQVYLCIDRMMAFLTRSLSGMTFGLLTEDLGEGLLTWFQAAFPVKTSVSQEKAKGLTGRGLASGRKWPALLVRFDPSTCSWRIAQHSLFGDLAEFSETWPRWGTMRSGECWALSMPGLHTSGNASGLLPTPLASLATNGDPNHRDSSGRPGLQMAAMMWQTPTVEDAGRKGSKEGWKKYQEGNQTSGCRLRNQVQMWPTPNCPNGGRSVKHVTDWRGKSAYHNGKKVQVGLEAAVKMWPTPVAMMPTPTVHGNYNRKGMSKNSGDGLATFVAKFPTPCAQDAKNSPLPVSQRAGYLLKQREQPGGQLNPTWVEWLMGWPVGWSSLNKLTPKNYENWRVKNGCTQERTRSKAVRDMRSVNDSAKVVERKAGQYVQWSKVVQFKVLWNREQKGRCRNPDNQEAGPADNIGRYVRKMRFHKKCSATPRKWEFESDSLPILSHSRAHQNRDMGTWWEIEPASIPRVTSGVKCRVDRLKAIGNGQVPVVAALAWRILTQSHKQQGEIQS